MSHQPGKEKIQVNEQVVDWVTGSRSGGYSSNMVVITRKGG
jgi:hypothetical protein